ncbi:MAG: hypothetical protein HY017_33545 [Betaproteobacteria bacterium]|nr:hypothetical protein [Betaproteobacteria bacterium]
MDGYESSNWYGLVGPAGLRKPLVGKLNAVVVDALNDPGIREKLAQQGLEATPSSPAEFSEFLRAELVKWAKIVKDTGSRPD